MKEQSRMITLSITCNLSQSSQSSSIPNAMGLMTLVTPSPRPQPPARAPEQQQLTRQRHIRAMLVDIVVALMNLAKNAAIDLGGGGDRQLAIWIQQRKTRPGRL